MHPLWHGEYVHRVTYTHLPPEKFVDKLALNVIRLIRYETNTHRNRGRRRESKSSSSGKGKAGRQEIAQFVFI